MSKLILKNYLLILYFISNGVIFSQNLYETDSTVIYYGKVYHKVKIGDQLWLKENLDIGNMIQVDKNQTNNDTIEKYCYDNKSENCEIYGGLYQWAEAVQYKNNATSTTSPNPPFVGHVQGICPEGWHLPSLNEFITLERYVNYHGNELKAIGQGVEYGVGTNTSGFSALLTSSRFYDGTFTSIGDPTFWSSSTDYNSTAYVMSIMMGYNTVGDITALKNNGFCVRCLKDNPTSVHMYSEIPTEYALFQNYPNPFNPITTIKYSVPQSSLISIIIFDVLGKNVATILNEYKPAGSYSVEFDGNKLASGIYFYQMRAGNFIDTKKLLLIK